MPAGTGTPAANQNSPYIQYSPSEIVTAAGPLSINAPAPVVDITLGSQFVTKAYDLAVYPALRPELIFDQFATVRASNTTHRGGSVRFSFVDDLTEQVTPLLENIDVDSISMASKALTVTMREYGTAVTNTALIRATSMISLDPLIAERVGYNAGISVDTLARVALDQTTVTYDDASTATVGSLGDGSANLSGVLLRQGVARLRAANVRPMRGGNYVAVISPYQAQQLMSESTDTGFRWMVGYSGDNTAGNSIFMGEVGTYEGVRLVVNNHLTSQGRGYLMGAEALAKAYSTAPGFGPNPKTVVAPITDKLRRFASVGWYHLVGYSIFRAEALLQIRTSSALV
jgi:N4-gp56 family major capsid protein